MELTWNKIDTQDFEDRKIISRENEKLREYIVGIDITHEMSNETDIERLDTLNRQLVELKLKIMNE
jgi:hypothetical protein